MLKDCCHINTEKCVYIFILILVIDTLTITLLQTYSGVDKEKGKLYAFPSSQKKNHNMEKVVNAFLINVNITLYIDP